MQEVKKTILATLYAVNPTKGSEDGMGWNFVLQVARNNNILAITRENNRGAIEKYQNENPSPLYDSITFIYYDLPYWMRFWKKGNRGALLYYWMWQRGVPAFVKKQNLNFDIVHNLNFHNDWTPSYLWKLGKPFVWGPIGHHPSIPRQYLKPYGTKFLIKDKLTALVKNYFWHWSPHLKKTAEKADHIFAMNKSVVEKINQSEDKFTIMPSVATQDFGFSEKHDSEKFRIISAGRFVPLKGFDLSIRAFHHFIKDLDPLLKETIKLTLVGKGPSESYLKDIIQELGITENVEIINWVERDKLMEMMKESSAFLFPSHEGAGMVVAEALSFAMPVICFDNCGPGEFITAECGISVPYQSYEDTVIALASGISEIYSNPQKQREMRISARKRFEGSFDWDRRGEQLQRVYSRLKG